MIVESSKDDSGSILTVTLNDPRKRNALSMDMLGALTHTIDKVGQDDNIRVVIVRGSGPAFCAGHDLKELQAHRQDEDGGADFYSRTMNACSQMMLGILRCPKPIIAQVHGIATAAGCQLVASCDLAVASSDTRFATPGVNLGLFCSTPMVAISRNLSRKHTMEMLLTGEMLPADKAAELGLVNRVVDSEQLGHECLTLARRIASRSVTAIRIGKQAYYQQLDMDIEQAYKYVNDVMVSNMLEADANEGINAFIEKRDPNWTT